MWVCAVVIALMGVPFAVLRPVLMLEFDGTLLDPFAPRFDSGWALRLATVLISNLNRCTGMNR